MKALEEIIGQDGPIGRNSFSYGHGHEGWLHA